MIIVVMTIRTIIYKTDDIHNSPSLMTGCLGGIWVSLLASLHVILAYPASAMGDVTWRALY